MFIILIPSENANINDINIHVHVVNHKWSFWALAGILLIQMLNLPKNQLRISIFRKSPFPVRNIAFGFFTAVEAAADVDTIQKFLLIINSFSLFSHESINQIFRLVVHLVQLVKLKCNEFWIVSDVDMIFQIFVIHENLNLINF